MKKFLKGPVDLQANEKNKITQCIADKLLVIRIRTIREQKSKKKI